VWFLFPVARVAFERTLYSVNKTAATVEICAVVLEPDIDCPISFDFSVTFQTADESAGL